MKFEYFIGVDIASKTFVATTLEKSLKPLLTAQEFDNGPDGFDDFVTWLTAAKIDQTKAVICMEATGVYAEALCYYLHAQDWWLAVHPPLEIKRAFAPVGHKTDAVDSRQIAEYAIRFTDKLRRWQPKKALLEQIRTLLNTREQFVRQRTMHKNTLRALKRKPVQTPLAEKLLQESIEHFNKNVKIIESEIKDLLKSDDNLYSQFLLVKSIKGVGLLLASHVLVMNAILHEPLKPKVVSAWLGISPYEKRSGSSVFGKARSRRYGPATMRKLLYLASCSLCTHHPDFQLYFERKIAEGKPKKLVLNNIANKLVKIMCAVLRENKPYIPNYRSVNPAVLS
jgi:transposase